MHMYKDDNGKRCEPLYLLKQEYLFLNRNVNVIKEKINVDVMVLLFYSQEITGEFQ